MDRRARLERNVRRSRPPPNYPVEDPVHVVTYQQAAPNRYLRCERGRKAVRGVIRADSVLASETVELLRAAVGQPSDPAIRTRGTVIGGAGERVAALNRKESAAPLLESDLKRVVAGHRTLEWQSRKTAIELRIWPQQVQQRYLRIVVPGI